MQQDHRFTLPTPIKVPDPYTSDVGPTFRRRPVPSANSVQYKLLIRGITRIRLTLPDVFVHALVYRQPKVNVTVGIHLKAVGVTDGPTF